MVFVVFPSVPSWFNWRFLRCSKFNSCAVSTYADQATVIFLVKNNFGRKGMKIAIFFQLYVKQVDLILYYCGMNKGICCKELRFKF